MTGVEILTNVFGTRAALARAAEVHPTLVSYWLRHGGDIPHKYRRRLRSAISGLDGADAATDCLKIVACECCGRPLE